ncbi:MAG: prepilin-type N-terminal cleavage/methylation domain-containing protein [Pyrinomonadaceae bacterium]
MFTKTLKHNTSIDRRSGEAGFSLVELIVSITLFLIVTGAIYGVLDVARKSRTAVSQDVELSKAVRVGMALLGRDTYNAGYGYPLKSTVILPDNRISVLLGIPNDIDTTRDTVPPIIAGNNITVNTLNPTSNTKTDQVTFLFKDPTFNLIGIPPNQISTPLSVNAATTNGSGIDEIVPLTGSNSVSRINDIYLVTGNAGSTLAVVTAKLGSNKLQFANADLLNFNQTGTGGPLRGIVIPAALTRVLMVTYFVTSDGTLTRRDYANVPPPPVAPAYVDEPLVYGVEDFQIKYVMDNGTQLDNPAAGPDGIIGNTDDEESLLQGVRQIRFTVNVRSNELDSSRQPFRTSMTSVFSTRNLGYAAN